MDIFPLRLGPLEEYSILLQLEPSPAVDMAAHRSRSDEYIVEAPREEGGEPRRKSNGLKTDQSNHEGLSSTNLFQTQAKIFWSVIGEERTKSSHAPIKNQIFVSTVEVKWERELHLDSGSVLLMEMEHDNAVEVNRIFTVNIALVENGHPIMGVIYVPVLKTLYVGVVGQGAKKWENIEPTSETPNWESGLNIPVQQNRETYIMVGSRSHMSEETTDYMEKLRSEKGEVEVLSRGSSLKLCMVAEGSADQYPRFAPTMEWDTGAGHAICKAAGFKVDQYPEMTELKYNKENLLNPWFLVH